MKTLALLLLLAATIVANAQQFAFAPKWKLGEEVILDYTYIKYRNEEGRHASDSIHANIKLKLIAEDASAYTFMWQFVNLYIDTVTQPIYINKLATPYLVKIATALPIVLGLNKPTGELSTLNKLEIDSVMKKAAKEMDAKYSSNSDEKSYLLSSGFILDTDYDIHVSSIVKEYFNIYTDKNLVLDKKLSIAEANKGKKSLDELALGFGSSEGYALLSKTNDGVYNYHYELNVDLSSMLPAKGAKSKGESKKDIRVNAADGRFVSSVAKDILDLRGSKSDMYSVTRKSLIVVK
jgi:hypothetical protein